MQVCPLYNFNGTQEQPLHYHCNRIDGKEKCYVVILPMSLHGFCLRLKPRDKANSDKAKLLFVPFGKAIMIPSDTFRSGGYLINPISNDMRLHFHLMPPCQPLPSTLDCELSHTEAVESELSEKEVRATGLFIFS